jgi:ferredoxin/flavodoxin
MRNKIFYFSGTGNALAIGKALSERLGDAELVPMATTLQGYAEKGNERIGLVFPVYAWGMPRIVEDFVRKLDIGTDSYVFAVVTCAGTPGRTLQQLRKTLRARGSDLHAGFTVRGDHTIALSQTTDMPIIQLIGWLGRKSVPASASQRFAELADTISAKQIHAPEVSTFAVNTIGSMMHPMAMRVFPKGAKDYAVSDSCVSCGTCVRICPRENVHLEDGRPSWQQDCEMCYACMAWCPQKAIAYRGGIPADPAHHPDVELSEMLLR